MRALPQTQPDSEDDLQSFWEEPLQAEYISREEGEKLLDEQARKYLGMSGSEFRPFVPTGRRSLPHIRTSADVVADHPIGGSSTICESRCWSRSKPDSPRMARYSASISCFTS
jgi:hypothetical protein